jgi:hypothetical protein
MRKTKKNFLCVNAAEFAEQKEISKSDGEREGELKGPFGCRTTTRRRVVLVEIINVLWAVCTVSSHSSRNVRVNQTESEN